MIFADFWPVFREKLIFTAFFGDFGILNVFGNVFWGFWKMRKYFLNAFWVVLNAKTGQKPSKTAKNRDFSLFFEFEWVFGAY